MTTTQTTTTQLRPTDATAATRRRFTVAEYYAMADAGILTADDRVELLDGEIIQIAPIGNRHAFCVDGLNETLVLALAGRALVRVQNPLRLDDGNEMQPDIAVVRRRSYAAGHPNPADVLLLIEVSDTTVGFDRGVKLPRYARAGIPEGWLANLSARRIEAYTEPAGDAYASVRCFEVGSSVSPQSFPDLMLPLARIIPA